MSALTGEWSVEKIRAVMVHLDRKTGLHGAELPIEMGKAVSYLGRYYCGERKSFYFSTHHLNDPAFRESEAIELIRHEYAHYYVDAAGLRPFFQDGRAHHHGPSWQYACKMVGASGRRVFGQDLLPELTAAELVRRFRAEDVRAFDMCGYIRMWNRLPSEPQQSARWMACVESGASDVGNGPFPLPNGARRAIIIFLNLLDLKEVFHETFSRDAACIRAGRGDHRLCHQRRRPPHGRTLL